MIHIWAIHPKILYVKSGKDRKLGLVLWTCKTYSFPEDGNEIKGNFIWNDCE